MDTEGRTKGKKSVVVETVFFIPFTPQSKLKRRLQEADDKLKATLSRPISRFVEKAGVTTFTHESRPSMWVVEVWCNRKDYLVCQGRLITAAEKKAEALKKVLRKAD